MAVVIGARRRQEDTNEHNDGSGHPADGDNVGGMRKRPSIAIASDDTDTKAQKLRVAIWNAFVDPSSSTAAYSFFVLILTLILVSCVAFVVETIPSYCCGRYETVSTTQYLISLPSVL